MQSVDRSGRPQLQLSLRLPVAQPHRGQSAAPFSPLFSLSLFLCLCAFSTCTRIFASFDSRRNSALFGQRRTAAAAAALHTFSSWPSRAVQRTSSSSKQQRSNQDDQSSRVFSLHCAHSSLVCAPQWTGRLGGPSAALLLRSLCAPPSGSQWHGAW